MTDVPAAPDEPPADPPPGFERHFRRSAVTDPWEPLWSRRADDPAREAQGDDGDAGAPRGAGPLQLGVRLGPRHCNSRGFVHGAVIAALADNAMGLTYVLASREAGRDLSGAVTVSLTVDYAASGRIGQWLQVSPRLLRAGGSMGFVDALVTADGDIAARASATFRAAAPR